LTFRRDLHVMPVLVTGIHALAWLQQSKAWMPTSVGMTWKVQ
jgi:hypothetical protein